MADGDPSVFEEVLGPAWHDLGPVVRRHYALRRRHDDAVAVVGTMDEVHANPVARLMMPFARLVGALVPYRGRDVPIVVHYATRADGDALHWDRVFRFPGRPPFHFRSRMVRTGPGAVIEFVRFGVGLRLDVTAEGGALVFRGAGYVWRLLGRDVPVPAGLLLGRAYVEERPAGDASFTMRMVLRHALFGELFRYSGRFAINDGSIRRDGTAG